MCEYQQEAVRFLTLNQSLSRYKIEYFLAVGWGIIDEEVDDIIELAQLKVARQQQLFNTMTIQETQDKVDYLQSQIDRLGREIDIYNETLKQKMTMRESLIDSKEELKAELAE